MNQIDEYEDECEDSSSQSDCPLPLEKITNGILELLPGAEQRPGQKKMIEVIQEALENNTSVIVQAGTGTGKALDINTPIITPTGWTTMKELKAGDKVFDENGMVCSVTIAHSIRYDRPCYEVIFSDGSALIADADHLWSTSTRSSRRNISRFNSKPEYTIRTTQEIKETVRCMTKANHAIPVAKPLHYKKKQLPIDPYVLGVWLGDGNQIYPHISTTNKDIIVNIQNAGYSVDKLRTIHEYSIHLDQNRHLHNKTLTTLLKEIGVFNNKHIPDSYLLGSFEQRLALLQGLMDTEGTVRGQGNLEFKTSNPVLLRNVEELIISLGIQCRIKNRDYKTDYLNNKTKTSKEEAFTIRFTTDIPVFRINRKLEQQTKTCSKRLTLRYIVDVKEIESRPVRCITVDSPNNLFLAGKTMIPTHNSLAYLTPVIASGKNAIVATASLALQDQLAKKDLPFLSKVFANLGWDNFSYAVLKGRSNYVCQQKISEITSPKEYTQYEKVNIFGDETVEVDSDVSTEEVEKLVEWSKSTQTGDKTELTFQVSLKSWGAVSTSSNECPGFNKCKFGSTCFAAKARKEAEDANIVVVNIHLYGADILSDRVVLPEHDIVIFDEAHEIEPILSAVFGVNFSSKRFTYIAQCLGKIFATDANNNQHPIVASIETMADNLKAILTDLEGERLVSIEEDSLLGMFLTDSTIKLQNTVIAVRHVVKDLSSRSQEVQDKLVPKCVRVINLISSFLDNISIIQSTSSDRVTWVENNTLNSCPIEIDAILDALLWPNISTAVLASATIPPNLDVRVGLEASIIDVGSPFDYKTQSLLFVPKISPPPKQSASLKEKQDYKDLIHSYIEDLINASQGRALVLFTSFSALNEAWDALSNKISYPMFRQGDYGKSELISLFSQNEASCLFATRSFWQGIDVPGQSLSLVIIDRIPFPRPDEPLPQAKRELAGGNGFIKVDIPYASTILAQGSGRLIRSKNDRGVVAVLDSRLATARYRELILKNLPNMKRTIDLDEVKTFFKETILQD